MAIFRYLLIFALAYYLLKFAGGLLPGKNKGRKGKSGPDGTNRKHSDYSDITDQKVDDADYEEL